MNNHSTKALKAGIWYTISNFLSKGIVFLTTPIFARLLSTYDYGMFSNYTTWKNLLLIITTLELSTTIGLARYDYEDDFDGYISSVTLFGALITGCFYLIFIAFQQFFCDFLGLDSLYIHIMFCSMLFTPALHNLLGKSRVMMKYKTASMLSFVSSISSVIFSIILVIALDNKLFGRIIGQELVLIAFNVAIFTYLILKGRKFKFEYARYALMLALPLIPHLLAGNLLGSFDKIMIEKICGVEQLAFYSLAFNCSLLAKVLWDSLNQAMSPWLYQKLNENNYDEIKTVSRYYILFFIIIAFGIMLFAPEVIHIFGGKEYLDAKYVMPPIIMGSCFQFTYSMYVNVEFYLKKTMYISIGTIISALANIILNFLFIPRFGYIAAAYTTMISYGILLIIHFFTIKKFNMSHIYDNKLNFSLMIIMMVVTCICEFVYMSNILRIVCIFVYALVLLMVTYKNKEQILNLVKGVLKKD